MSFTFQPIRGTRDILRGDLYFFNKVINYAKNIANLYCYEEIITPIFENSSVFHHTLGETSDVVSKETYTFIDRDKTSITLRPEFTAATVRAIISNGLTQSLPLKFFNYGPVFRHERPQHCRYRQFNQINFEFLGPNDPKSDIEIISLAVHLLKELNLEHLVNLEINTVGDLESRKNYSQSLISYLQKHKHSLSEDSLRRLEFNPLRILDSKDQNDKHILKEAPSILNYLTKEADKYYREVISLLEFLSIKYKTNTNLVRGLDYYTHTVFEFTTESLGSQGTVLAGGRYNGLVKLMGGPNINAIGFAAGIERLVELHKKENSEVSLQKNFHLIPIGEEAEKQALKIAEKLRSCSFNIYLNYNSSLKKRMQQANKLNALAVILFGDTEMQQLQYRVKGMKTGKEVLVDSDSLISFLLKI
ncbi:MAG: histidine--tRNA ligase [Candidatus Midichloria sp.]|nr:MAG: histidine--tRNA ligase [Candidatus Midichloria sp.]